MSTHASSTPQQLPFGNSSTSALVTPDVAHLDAITQSHERCAALGLRRVERPDHTPLIRADLATARERNLRLHAHAAPVMELLLEQIMATQSMVVLTDTQGTILHSVGHDDFLRRASKVALAPGVSWAEANKGTNAIGTALVTEAPTFVHADEHFMRANDFLTCSAAPIFDPRGNMLGVLDVTGDHRSYHQHTMGLVKMSARMIENHWLSDDFRHAMRLHFHSRPEFIGTLLEGILAVARDGRIVGANRAALDQLNLSSAAVRMNSVVSLLGTTPGAIVDHFRSPMANTLALTLANGQQVHVRARFNWPMWHNVGTSLPDEEAAAPSAPAATATEPARAWKPAQQAQALQLPQLSGLRYLQTGDAQMEAVIAKIRRVLDRDISILVLGETGTGKELLARAIHQDSERARQPFVAVNCASIPETLIEAELFGYEEGAFTGARRKGSLGKILQANGGTLFLDEIGDMPLALQAHLLRVLQERQVTPLGSSKSVPVDVTVVSATHRNLREMIGRGEFREDLYYRLNGLVVKLPALRERSDLLTIVQKILRVECSGRTPELVPDVLQLLQGYTWPGNIRQLSNVLRTAAVMAAGEPQITRAHLSDDFIDDAERAVRVHRADAPQPAAAPLPQPVADTSTASMPPSSATTTLEALELQTIRRALEEAGGNISVASKRLGISRNTIYRKLRWNVKGPGET
jgi:transcriptional regulator of acetoin/glycerol metabolism